MDTEPDLSRYMTGEDLSPAQLKALAKAHMIRFARMILSGSPSVRVSDCKFYLEVWNGVERKANWSLLDVRERQEVQDAVLSGDYDELLESSRG